MNNSTILRRFLEYNIWANARLVENIKTVDPAIVANAPLAPFGSIHATLRHIVGAQHVWMLRLNGTSPRDLMQFTEGKGLSDTCTMLVDTAAVWVDHAETNGLDPDQQVSFNALDGSPHTMNMTDIMLHLVNHSTYHRGQIMSALRTLTTGQLLGLDMISYARDHAEN